MMLRGTLAGVFLLSSCAALRPKPTPDDVCLLPCERAIGRVDAFMLDGKYCSCYRASDPSTGDPGTFVRVPL